MGFEAENTYYNESMQYRGIALQLRDALKSLHDDTEDYIVVNHLGKTHHNYSMRIAAEALAAAEEIL